MSTDDPEMAQREAVGKMVRAHRELSGKNVTQAADEADVGRSTWSAIESGRSPLGNSIDTLVRMANVVDAPVPKLMDALGRPDLAEVARERAAEVSQRDAERLSALQRQVQEVVANVDALTATVHTLGAAVVRSSRRGAAGAPGAE